MLLMDFMNENVMLISYKQTELCCLKSFWLDKLKSFHKSSKNPLKVTSKFRSEALSVRKTGCEDSFCVQLYVTLCLAFLCHRKHTFLKN